jgi:purine-cytosine permease-like protein
MAFSAWWFAVGFVAGVVATMAVGALCAHAAAAQQAALFNKEHQKMCADMQAQFAEIQKRKEADA